MNSKYVVDKSFFPGFVRKAVTFTIDDGNPVYDKKFLDILRPAGILGTFNLCGVSAEKYGETRALYEGYEVANHVKLHPNIFKPGIDYPLSDEIYDLKNPAGHDTAKFYRHPDVEGVYFSHGSFFAPKVYADKSRWWFRITDADTYIRLIDMADAEITAAFGKGACRSFVWPFGKQADSKKVLEHVKKLGYYGARDAGAAIDSFDMPKDRMDWRYCATHGDLLAKMERFVNLPDDGELKFFSFGVHSIDYENAGKWDDLRIFADKYGGRAGEFYYASVGEIFAYEDAINSVTVNEKGVVNPSDVTAFVTVNGARAIIPPHSYMMFESDVL